MSKKIMKRSLALGALMAFVITGSAFAEVTKHSGKTWDEKYYVFHELSGTQETITKSDYDIDKVLGAEYNVSSGTVSTTDVTISGGTFDVIAGGYYANKYEEKSIANLKDTNLSVVNQNVKATQVVGGSVASYTSAVDYKTQSTNLSITAGTFGREGVAGNCPEDFVVAGDLMKWGDGAKTPGNLVSSVDNTNLIISGGTFNSVIIGGSASVENYTNAAEKIETNVVTANTTITDGAFNKPIVAGGLAWGHETKSTVGTANLTIVGSEGSGLTFNSGADIYAGGAYGEHIGASNRVLEVKESNVKIENATVKNIYGTALEWRLPQVSAPHTEVFTALTNEAVNTNLSLTNVTANTIDLPKGTLTLAGTNNVKNITIGADVTEVNIASKALAEGSSLTGDGKGDLKVEGKETALTITGITAGTYNIASGYATNEANKFVFNQEDELLDAKAVFEGGVYKVEVTAKSANDIANKLETTESTGNFVKDIITEGNDEATEFLDKLMESDATNAVINDTLAAVQKMGEAGGNSATAANIVKNVTGVTNDRLSFNCGHSAPHKGGHGVGLFEEGSGADIWVEYVHGKDEVEDMPSTAGASSYEGQYNGIVMGVDFKKVGKFQSGIAFNYGEGDTNSVGSAVRTHSDYDFWGVGYYGNIHNDDSNVIFDINYAQTDSDVTQSSAAGALEASPETTTWSAGVKLEKLYQNENVQIVPYTGLRYMSIDSDDYATKGGGFMYNMERQNIWLLPVGVSIRQEIANDNGWTVSPRVDLSYIWAFGDTNSNMEVKVGNGITPIGYDVMDDGSFLGLVGIEAHKGQWGYGVAYSYQKGDHSESKKWYVDVNYSF